MTEEKQTANIERAKDFLSLVSLTSIPDVEMLERALELEGEPAITMWLKWMLRNDGWTAVMSPLGVDGADTVIFNYPLRIGAADIVIFHVDGTATVVELKDGAQGFRTVIGGLGQAGLYAAQLDPAKALRGVRRALAWTPVNGHAGVNDVIAQAVTDAGAIPIRLVPHQAFIKDYLRQQLVTTLDATRQALAEMKP